MAINYPGISYLKGYDRGDPFAKFADGFGFGKGLRDEAAVPAAVERSTQSLREYGLPENIGELMRNPNTRDVGIAALKEATQRRHDATDPMRQLQLQRAQVDLATARRGPAGPAPTAEMRNFQMAQQDPKFLEFIGAKGATKAPADVQEYLWFREEEKAAGREPMPYLDFIKAQKGDGLSVQTNPDGTVSVTQGGMPKLTEGQSKDVVYLTKGAGALPTIDAMGDALTSLPETVGGAVPVVGEYMKSPEFQQAEQAGLEFLAAVLRKDTGAAVTKSEEDMYGRMYLPRPGNSPEVLVQKKAARRRALKAIELGIPPKAILEMEQQGVVLPDDAAPSEPPGDAAPALPDGATEEDIEFTMQKHGLTREQVLERLNGP
jgi:hypothetical protein